MPADPIVLLCWGLLVHQLNRLFPGKGNPVSTVQIAGLASALRDLKKFSSDTSALAQQVSDTLKNGGSVIAQVKDVHTQIRAAVAEVQAELGAVTNGGPPLDDVSSFPPATPAAPVTTPAAPGLPDAGRFNDPPHN